MIISAGISPPDGTVLEYSYINICKIKTLRINSEIWTKLGMYFSSSCCQHWPHARFGPCKLVLTGRPRAARECLVELTGTTPSICVTTEKGKNSCILVVVSSQPVASLYVLNSYLKTRGQLEWAPCRRVAGHRLPVPSYQIWSSFFSSMAII